MVLEWLIDSGDALLNPAPMMAGVARISVY
jgi:hypothetical protein